MILLTIILSKKMIAIVYRVGTKLLSLNGDIFIPELRKRFKLIRIKHDII